jgi:hypothetical protein
MSQGTQQLAKRQGGDASPKRSLLQKLNNAVRHLPSDIIFVAAGYTRSYNNQQWENHQRRNTRFAIAPYGAFVAAKASSRAENGKFRVGL